VRIAVPAMPAVQLTAGGGVAGGAAGGRGAAVRRGGGGRARDCGRSANRRRHAANRLTVATWCPVRQFAHRIATALSDKPATRRAENDALRQREARSSNAIQNVLDTETRPTASGFANSGQRNASRPGLLQTCNASLKVWEQATTTDLPIVSAEEAMASTSAADGVRGSKPERRQARRSRSGSRDGFNFPKRLQPGGKPGRRIRTLGRATGGAVGNVVA